jgi:hypothetical protein
VYQLAADLEQAVAEEDDRRIVQIAAHSQDLLAGFQLVDTGSRTLLTRRRLALDYQKRLAGVKAMELDALILLASNRLRSQDALLLALAQGSDDQVWFAYKEYERHFVAPQGLSSAQQDRLQTVLNQARRRRRDQLQADIRADDDFGIVNHFEPGRIDVELSGSDETATRADTAARRVSALQQIRAAANDGDHAQVVRLHEKWCEILRPCSQYTARDRRALIAARQELARQELDRSITTGSDTEILTAFQGAIAAGCGLSNTQLRAARAARKRIAAEQRDNNAKKREIA